MKEMQPKPRESKRGLETQKPFEISTETATATLGVVESIQTQGKIGPKQAEKLVDSIANDVKANGIDLTKDQQEQWKKDAVASLSGEIQQQSSLPEDEKLNIKEYADMLHYLSNVYDLKHNVGNIAAMESVMVANKVTLASIGTGPFALIGNISRSPDLLPKVGELIQDVVFEGKRKFDEADKAFIKDYVKKVGWPVYIPLIAAIPINILDGQVRKQFVSKMGNVRQAINHRVGESIFMRDFEFIHDKSSAEIMSTINKGKESTIELFEKTYLTMIPTIAKTISGVIPQMATNPMGAALAAVRIGVGFKSGERLTKNILQKRGELIRKQEKIDTRIMTSLSGLDVIKTSDSMQESIKDLENNMKTRDDLAKDMGKMNVARDKQQERIEAALSLGIPFLTGAWDIVKAFGGVKHIPEIIPFMKDPDLNHLDIVKRGLGTGLGILHMFQSNSSQGTMDAGLQILANTYARDIKPALQDIKRMENLLGPYDQVDRPDGPKEKNRKGVSALPNFDIKVTNLQFKNILHNVNMDIPQGSFVTIKGPSGIGKTTFFQHLVGLYGASEGAIRYGGVDLQGIKKFGTESIYSKIAYANQNPQYFEDLTLRENLLMWTKKTVPDGKIKTVLHDLRLDHILDRIDSKVKHFSGGELRRIGIARALLKDPKVLFLDEPTANLDAESSKQVLEIIKDMRVKRPEMTVVAVTHDENFEKIAEQIVDFQKVNKPTKHDVAPLGTRQVFYAQARSNIVN